MQTDDYVSRLPSPPPIDIPPPMTNPVRGWKLPPSVRHNFLEGFTFADLHDHSLVVANWSFNERRRAQKILPFLYLGPIACSRDEQFLREQGISKIFAIPQLRSSSTVPASGPLRPGACEELGIEVQNSPLGDSQQLVHCFPTIIESINEHLTQRKNLSTSLDNPSLEGRVLICCQTGNDKSAALVVAYLMDTLHLTLEEAGQVVNLQRFSIDLNQPLKVVLQAYDGILQARREVAQDVCNVARDTSRPGRDLNPNSTSTNTSRSFKRRVDDLESMDTADDDDDPSDIARFQDRNFAPFQ